MPVKVFESFMERLSEFPFWVKEIIYLKLREEFEQAYLSETDMQGKLDEAYQAYIPPITFLGKTELEERNNKENESVYRFLRMAKDGCSIAEITLRNFWTLEKTAKVNIYCIQKEYLKKPSSQKIEAIALYIAGVLRIGEYFKRIGKINIDQLDTAIRYQKELEEKGEKVLFAEVLIKLGYITEQETKAVIYIKDECKTRFIFNSGLQDKTEKNNTQNTSDSDNQKDEQINNLKNEVLVLKAKLKEIESIIKR